MVVVVYVPNLSGAGGGLCSKLVYGEYAIFQVCLLGVVVL